MPYSRIQTHDPTLQAAKTHAPDRAATVNGHDIYWPLYSSRSVVILLSHVHMAKLLHLKYI
jgi:hypothetical protein